MTTSKSLLWFVPIVLVGLVVWFVVPADNAEKQVAKEGVPPKEKDVVREGPSAKPAPRAGCFFDTDYKASYIIKLHTKATFTHTKKEAAVPSNSAPSQKLDSTLTLSLHLRHIQTQDNHRAVEGMLNAAASTDSNVQKLWSTKEIESPFFIKLSTACEFQAFAFRSGIQAQTQVRISALMQMMEVHFSPNLEKPRWSVTQNDKNGQALVQYRRMQQSDFHFGRKRLTYIKHWQSTAEHFTRAGIRASRGLFEATNDAHWLKSLESTEFINFFAAKELVAQKEMRIELKQQEATTNPWNTLKPNPATLQWRAAISQPPGYISDLLVE